MQPFSEASDLTAAEGSEGDEPKGVDGSSGGSGEQLDGEEDQIIEESTGNTKENDGSNQESTTSKGKVSDGNKRGNMNRAKNLHVTGFGRATQEQLEQAFGAHCNLINVVMKDGYCFVNTMSMEEAKRGLEALQGVVRCATASLELHEKLPHFDFA